MTNRAVLSCGTTINFAYEGAYMATSNIDRFDQLTGRIFADLYKSFPVPKILSDIGFSDLITANGDEAEIDSDQVVDHSEFFVHTVRWLESSGYVTHRKQAMGSPYVFEVCVLTAKGLEALKSTPASLGGKSLGQSLQEAAKAGTMDTVKTLSGQVLSAGVSMITKAAMSHIQGA